MFCFQDIKFPMMLDVFDLCTESLQQKLLPAREKFKIEEDKKLERASKVCKLLSTLVSVLKLEHKYKLLSIIGYSSLVIMTRLLNKRCESHRKCLCTEYFAVHS